MDFVEKGKEIYTEAFNKYQDDTRSCLWDKPMIMRYSKLKEIVPEELEGKKILEIGCGIGGFYDYLINDCNIKKIQYTGIDIVEGMIELAAKKYPEASFQVADLFQEKLEETFDYVFICGLFNVKLGNDAEFLRKMLIEAFSYCRKGIAFNYISSYVNFQEEEMVYHRPEDVLEFCVEKLSRKISLYHHYGKCDVAMYVERGE